MKCLSAIVAWSAQLIRAAKYLFVVRRALPAWLMWLLVIAALPIPGPVDEAALVVAIALLVIRHRPLLCVCWEAARQDALKRP